MSQHTATPWRTDHLGRIESTVDRKIVATITRDGDGELNEVNAAYIVKAVNGHQGLVNAALAGAELYHQGDGCTENEPCIFCIALATIE